MKQSLTSYNGSLARKSDKHTHTHCEIRESVRSEIRDSEQSCNKIVSDENCSVLILTSTCLVPLSVPSTLSVAIVTIITSAVSGECKIT